MSNKKNDDYNQKNVAIKISVRTMIANAVLTIFKLIAGIFANSSAMLSDAVHTASDVLSTIIVMIGISIADKKADKEHPYGHERLECIAAIILSMMLFITGIGIGYDGIKKIMSGINGNLQVPKLLAVVAAVVSIVAKEWMYQYTKRAAEKVNSGALMADAWHHRSDSFSSIGSLIAIIGSRLGFPILDPIASLVICIFIFKAAYDIFNDALKKMVDNSCNDETIEEMKQLIIKQNGVKSLDSIKTRMFGNRIYVDVEIAADKDLTLEKAHGIAEKVHDEIENKFDDVKHCMIHVNPYYSEIKVDNNN